MKPRNIENTIVKGKELEEKDLVTFYIDEITKIRELSVKQAREKNSKTNAEFFANYEYCLISNALDFGASVGFNAGMRKAKKNK